jgi:hypothetical protein
MSPDFAFLISIFAVAVLAWIICAIISFRPRLYVQFGGRVSTFKTFAGIEYEAVSREQEKRVSEMPKICFFISGSVIYFKCAGDVKPFGTTEAPGEVPDVLPNTGVLVDSVSIVFNDKNPNMRTVIF